ncbi:N-acetylglucosaminyl-phosphatidylinositol biosynthetic protein gpi1 [Cyphellophora attinorum]|uniref:N-acetylglucosaminyl-phosphatidylinositol biosynthetic protein gpi1 n=1 Tax=Cyphellophora attinorum TaxID=1664694 RepID=A0A0N0NI96_9EURO|nr:N-acetylglucosaminyl-phosphatidylinositol biosynthetic protein gpi1 [Phialophora attinorum]KPI35179.1 N-acetylglucosaminyl-phosphatidylinositol biosynthetic protein gpi1 [Phialophora attinorum]
MFDPPDPSKMQYVSQQAMSLSLDDNARSRTSIPPEQRDEIEEEEERERKRKAQLVSKLKFHTVVRHQPTRLERALPTVLRQINSVKEVAELVHKNSPLVGPRRKRSMSVSDMVVESAQSLYTFAAWSLWTLFMTSVYPTLLSCFKVAIVAHRAVAEGLLQILEWHLPIQSIHLPDGPVHSDGPVALKDISACCQQVHLRLEQFSYYPSQYARLRKRSHSSGSVSDNNSDYIRFYNSLWLVANDVIIGIAIGSFINDNATQVSRFLATIVNEYTIEGLKRMIRWLMDNPGGLKLNTELAAFLGDLFLWVIEYWSGTLIYFVVPHLPTMVYFISVSSFAGASMPIAILSDLISLLTIHIYSFYIASARIFNWQLTIIVSLFHLFRGKKRNVLRNRIDNCDYDLDQLLLGTILFTLLFFLLPTVIVFYITFAFARMSIITVKASLDSCLACLNHFPLFAIMLRVKDSKRLPGGIHLRLIPVAKEDVLQQPAPSPNKQIEDDDESPTSTDFERLLLPNVSYIGLSSHPLSLRQIFEEYFQLGSRIRKHYLSANVVFRLLTGRFVPPLGRDEMYGLQYSVLPRHRIGVAEMWKILNEAQDKTSGEPPWRVDGRASGQHQNGSVRSKSRHRR